MEISQSELKVVRYVLEPVAAVTTPRKSPVIASLALAERRGPAAPQVSGNVAVTVDGGVYGLRGRRRGPALETICRIVVASRAGCVGWGRHPDYRLPHP